VAGRLVLWHGRDISIASQPSQQAKYTRDVIDGATVVDCMTEAHETRFAPLIMTMHLSVHAGTPHIFGILMTWLA
jgi:hypothetical protein